MIIRDQAYCICSNQRILSCSHVPKLSSLQEEADTKMFLRPQVATSLGFHLFCSLYELKEEISINEKCYRLFAKWKRV